MLFASVLFLAGPPKGPASSNGTPVGDHLILPLFMQGLPGAENISEGFFHAPITCKNTSPQLQHCQIY